MIRSSVCLGLAIQACAPMIARGFDDPPKPTAAGSPGRADWPRDSADLLKRLLTRDAEFDGRSIETERRWVEKVSPSRQIAARRFDARRFGQPDPGSPPKEAIPADFDQPHRLRRLLTVRGAELTIERLDDLETMKHPEFVAIPNRGCRWSSVGGVERVWSPETNDLHVLGPPSDDGLLRWDAHMIRWTCGHGLARWITSVDSMRGDDGLLTAKVRMRLMGYDDSRAELRFDRDLILRRAVVSVPGSDGSGFNEYVVETRGAVRPDGCPPVAESGRFRRVVKPVGKPETVDQNDELRFVSVSPRLTDDQYRERTRIEPRPDATVIDARRTK